MSTNLFHRCIKFVPQNSRPIYCCNCNKSKFEHANAFNDEKNNSNNNQSGTHHGDNEVSNGTQNNTAKTTPQIPPKSSPSTTTDVSPLAKKLSIQDQLYSNNENNVLLSPKKTQRRSNNTSIQTTYQSYVPSYSPSSSNQNASNASSNIANNGMNNVNNMPRISRNLPPIPQSPKKKGEIRRNFIFEQQSKGEIENANLFFSQILLKDLLLEVIPLSETDTEEVLSFLQSKLDKSKSMQEKQFLLRSKEMRFLQREIIKINNFIGEQEDLKKVIQIQSLARRYLTCKRFSNLNRSSISALKKKNEFIIELLKTERDYNKNISFLIEHFVLPLRHTDCIEPQEAASIFSNIETIADVHKQLYQKLIHAVDRNFPFVEGIGQIFLDINHMMKAYYVYMNNFKNAINELDRLYSENPRFSSFILEKSRQSDMDLRLLLTFPVNRISQYEYYLQQLVDNLPNESEEYNQCVKALSVLAQSSLIIQTNLIQSSETAKIMSYQRRIKSEGMPMISLLKFGRKFLFESRLKKYILILFNDVLVVTKLLSKTFSRNTPRGPHNDFLSLVSILPLDKLQLVDLDLRTFDLKQTEENLTYRVLSNAPEEKSSFVRYFNNALEELNRSKIFGIRLLEVVIREERSNGIPIIVENTINYLVQSKSIEQAGVFRVAGSQQEIQTLRTIFDRGGDDALNLKYEKYSPFSVCDVLKLYFRSLPEPLLGFSLYSPLVSLMRDETITTPADRIDKIKNLLEMWTPPFALKVLKHLILFLHQVSQLHEVNKMTTTNLSIVFGPTLLWPEQNTLECALDMPVINRCVQLLIENVNYIFA